MLFDRAFDPHGFDAVDNLVALVDPAQSATTYGYDAAGRINSIGASWNTTLPAFSTRTYETQAFDFDGAGQLETVDSNLANRDASYNYGANGNRTSASEPVGGSDSYQTIANNRVSQDSTYNYVKRRYQYGLMGEVLFDQVYDATGNPTLQGEQDLYIPLSDHQHSTRVVLAHAGDDSTYVRQSLDYAEFGRVTATLGANGLADAGGSVTIFGHHGSIADAATGLQLKGERWYSPDLGRFVSEDPIQDGANWYMFAGNDPVNYADPTGLSLQGYPLGGGFSGNVTMAPTIGTGSITANNLGLGPALSTSTNNFIRGAVNQAVNSPRSTPAGNGRVMLPLAPAAEEAVVRQITAGANIRSRPLADLPGIRAAWDNPNHYLVGNHNDQGYNVLAPDGSVRFVTGEDYIPIREQLRRAGVEGQSAAGRAQFFNLVGEGIASHPFAETARDGGIYAFGYDFYNPNEHQSENDQRRAGQMLFLPGVNSKQVNYANETLEALQDFRRAQDKLPSGVRDRGPTLGQEQGREFRIEQLETYEFDANQPKHVRGYLENERRRITGSGGGPDVPRTPPGYVQGHGRTTPAREGFDYSNSRLQGEDLNKLEERIRRRTDTQ